MFRRYPCTFGLGLAVVFCIVANMIFIFIAVGVNWNSGAKAAEGVENVATFFGRIASFLPSLLWTYNPSDPHSMMPFWFRSLVWSQGFIVGAFIDFLRNAHARRAQH